MDIRALLDRIEKKLEQLDRIEKKLDKLLTFFGQGETTERTQAELRRMAQAAIIKFEERRRRKEERDRMKKNDKAPDKPEGSE